jgi:hypothetical protein
MTDGSLLVSWFGCFVVVCCRWPVPLLFEFRLLSVMWVLVTCLHLPVPLAVAPPPPAAFPGVLQKGAVGAYLLSSSLVGGATVLGTTLPLLFLLPSAYTAAVAAIQTAWGYFLCGVAGVCVRVHAYARDAHG